MVLVTAFEDKLQHWANAVSEQLPVGYEIVVRITHGGLSVDLVWRRNDWHGDAIGTGPVDAEESVLDCGRRLVEAAKRHATQKRIQGNL